MKPTALQYPIFEANQVLTNEHLNELFVYLDEQERLTRTNLIGIGIVCGLELSLKRGTGTDGPTIGITRGCGVTSEGYLIIESADQALVRYRKYAAPTDIAYKLFEGRELLELFPEGTPSTDPLSNDLIKDRVVLLFLELKKEDLRNCSAVDCNDKGADVQVSLRRLLIAQKDLDDIIKDINDQKTGEIPADSEAMVLARLNLRDLRLPRYDVPNTTPVTSAEVLEAFIKVFQAGGRTLAKNTQDALTKAYTVFYPVLGDLYPKGTDPFSGFAATFNFLDSAPDNTDQVRFLQYYYDLFDDLIKAYDEFRWKGVDLLCACCPSEKLFPRHLMLGLLTSAGVSTSTYRHHFLASSAISNCEERTRELRLLFQRLVEMTIRFTDKPLLPVFQLKVLRDNQIRITPSKLGDVPISEKAIPYYYTQNGTPPLYQLWSPEKTRRNRANQNLGYFAGTYAPKDSEFVTDPLRYDLEPYNFLRIEGHLNKNYQNVLKELLLLKEENRLPFEVIALRAGAFNEKTNLEIEKARYQDLEIMYETTREALLCKWCHILSFLYDFIDNIAPEKLSQPALPIVKLFAACDKDFRVKNVTFGAYFEKQVWPTASAKPYGNLLSGGRPGFEQYLVALSVYLARFTEALPELSKLNIETVLKPRFKDLLQAAVGLSSTSTLERAPYTYDTEKLQSMMDEITQSCDFDPFESIYLEYQKRLLEAKQMQSLSFFLQKHPGIQHKAGVPIGGTFILVYHEDPAPEIEAEPIKPAEDILANFDTLELSFFNQAYLRMLDNPILSKNSDFQTITKILGRKTVQVTPKAPPPPNLSQLEKQIAEAVNELTDGVIIADFYLPYSLNAFGSGMQFVLPPPPVVFTLEPACPDDNGMTEVKINLKSGVRPLSARVDPAVDFTELQEDSLPPLRSGQNKVTLRDAAGAISITQTVVIPEPIKFENITYQIDPNNNKLFSVSFDISGGSGTYNLAQNLPGTISGKRFSDNKLEVGKNYNIQISDDSKSKCSKTIPLKPIEVSIGLDCTITKNARQVALTTINVVNGVGPIDYQLGGNNQFIALPNTPIEIDQTVKNISFRDNAGHVTIWPLNIPQALSITRPNYIPGRDGYTAAFTILNGTPPYRSPNSELTIEADGKASVKLPNSTSESSYLISDFSNCPLPIRLKPPKLVLPCGGESIRCAYRLWLQPPVGNQIYGGINYSGTLNLTFNGEEFQVNVGEVLGSIPEIDLNNNFVDTMINTINRLNQWVNESINQQFGTIGTERLSINYNKLDKYPFATMSIESFTCEVFEISFSIKFYLGDIVYPLEVKYFKTRDGHGVTFVNKKLTKDNTTFVPAFDCQTRNRDTDSAFKPRCNGPAPKPTFQTNGFVFDRPNDDVVVHPDIKIGSGLNLTQFSGSTDMDKEIVAWIWDAPTTVPEMNPFFVGKSIGVDLKQPKGPVRLTVITTQGCFGVFSNDIDIKFR